MSRFKIFASSLCTGALLLGASFTTHAQQLPNNGFEGTWNTCTPWTGGYGKTTIGQNPESWCISHVMGITTGTLLAGTGKKAMGEKTTGYKSNSAVKVFNEETGAMGITRVVPGYVTLGTTWSTAEGTKTATHDGGTWGGLSFTDRPDAVTFQYKREFSGTDKTENASFIAYLWKGSWTQANVPVTITSSGSASKTTMTNRDRNILGGDYSTTTTGGDVNHTDDAELIASVVEIEAKEVPDWTKKIIEFEYKAESKPTMLNIIFSANEYFNTKSATKGNSLYIDDVKLIYYSRLSKLEYSDNEKNIAIEGFDPDKLEYEVNVGNLPAGISAIKPTVLSPSSSSKATVVETNRTAKDVTFEITVTNSNGSGAGFEDIDGATSHTYTLKFKKELKIDLTKIIIGEKEFEPENGENTFANDVTLSPKQPFTKDIEIVVNGNQLKQELTRGGTNTEPTGAFTYTHPDDKDITKSYTLSGFLPYIAELQSITVGSKKLNITGNEVETGVEYNTANHPKNAVYNTNTSGTVTVDIEATPKDPANPQITVTVTNKDAIHGPISNTYTLLYNKPADIELSKISIGDEEFTNDGAAYANGAVINTGMPFTNDPAKFGVEVKGVSNPTFTLSDRTGTNEEPKLTLTIPHPVIPNSNNTYTLVFLPYKAEVNSITLQDENTVHVDKDATEIIIDADYSDDALPVSVTGASERISGSVTLKDVTKGTDINYPSVTITVENNDGFEPVTKQYKLKYNSPVSSRISGVTIDGTTYPVAEGNIIDISARPLPMPAIADITPVYILPDNNQTSRITLNTETGTGTVTITNSEGKDYDGKNSHEYSLKFAQVNLSRPKGITIMNASNTKALTLKPVFNSKTYSYEANGNRHDENIEERIRFEWFDGKELKFETATEGDEYEAAAPKLLVTVTNPSGGKDYDGEESHTYTFIFNPRTHENRSVSLGSIIVDGTAIPGFDPDVFDYELPYGIVTKDKIAWTLLEYEEHPTDGTVVGVEIDENAAIATIHVSNEISNSDGEDERTYTLHFLPYYSRLAGINAPDGTRIETFEETGEKINVTVPGQIPKRPNTEQEILESLVFPEATAGTISKELTVTMETVTATLTVSNEKPDVDGLKSHTYILKYDAPFYSRLEALKISGFTIPNFNRNTFSYTVDAQMPASPTIEATVIRGSNSAGKSETRRSFDVEKALVTVVVTNIEPDIDGESSHTYTVQYLLPYFSRLEALTIGGEAVAELPQDGKTPVAYSGFLPESDDAVKELFGYTFKEGSGTPAATVTVDRSTATARITVTNGGQKDTDGKTSHVYIVQFTLPYLSTASSITVAGEEIADFAADKYEYTVSGQMPAEENIAVDLSKGNGESTYSVESDAESATVTITVTNSGDAEGNHASTTTYILHFDLPYFSRLDALTVGGQEFTELPQDGVTPVNYSGLLPETDDAANKLFSYTFKKGSGNPAARVVFDRAKFMATITVTNGGQKDTDGKTSHVYIVQFALPYYSTASSITIGGESIPDFSPAQSDYTVSGQMPTSDQIGVQLNQGSGKSTYSIASDAESAIVTITVTNSGDAEGNNASTTTYTLHFDLPYFSRLASLKVRGEDVAGFDKDKFEYTLTGVLPAQSEIAGTAMKGSGKATVKVTRDTADGIATVTVTNSGGNDLDGKDTHSYILNFDKPVNSRLTSISIDGTPVPDFDTDIFSYNLTSQAMPAEGKVTAVSSNPNATISIDYNTAKSVVTIKVSAEGIDEDGEKSHTYTLTFKKEAPKPVEGTTTEYTGKLTIMMMGEDLTGGGQEAKVVIKKADDGTCTFMLPDFSLDLGDGPASLGDIVVENVTMTSDGKGGYIYSGDVKGLELAEGSIVADVTLTGTTDAEGNARMTIKVLWEGIEIDVEFNGVSTPEENPNPGPAPEEKWNSFNGTLSIEMAGSYLAENQPATVYITEPVNGKCTFKLPDFSIDLDGTELALGDIVVENVDVTEENGITTYSGFVPQMSFLDGEIIADINLKGTVDADGKAHMTIQVLWEGIEINVEFNGNRKPEENPNPGPAPSDEWNDFDGTLSIEMAGSYLAENQLATVYITEPVNGKCTFKLPDFSIDLDGTELALGDIVVENVNVSEENGITTYSGFVPQMSFLDGEIIADINLKGTVDAAGNAHMTIQVLWEGIEINVEFNGNRNEIAWLTFPGKLTVALEGYDITEGGKDAVVKIARTGGDGLYTFLLPDFSLALDAESAPAQLGDIQVDNITMTPNDGFDRYTGKVDRMVLADGNIVAAVKVDGTITTASEVRINVDVTWYMEDGKRVPILVKFSNTEDIPSTPERAVYTGTLTTETDGAMKDHNVRIHMTPSYGNRSDLLIEGIDLAGSRAAAIGNSISVPSVSITTMSNGYKAYDGAATSVQVQPGMTLDINLHGFSDLNNKFNLLMDIEWLEEGISISGKFNGEVDVTGIAPVVSPEDNDGKEEYYNINGIRVNPDNLRPGIYIRRKGNKSEKIIIK